MKYNWIYKIYFILYEIYNANMIAKFGEDTFTHPFHDSQVWLEVVASDRPNRNRVYDLLIASARELKTRCIVLIVVTPYFSPSYTSHEFDEIVHKWV